MKRIIVCTFCFLGFITSNAQTVGVKINYGIDSQTLQNSIEKNISALLSEINQAHKAVRPLDFHGIDISTEAQKSLSMHWQEIPFYCMDSEIVESVMTLSRGEGYQIRNIPLELTPSKLYSGDTYQEAVINFDKNGRIQSFCFPLSNNLYKQVLLEGNHVGDFLCREMILNWVEYFQTAYNQKDIDFLEKVFSNDALIITGKVIEVKPNDFCPFPQHKVIKVTQSKREYLDRLKEVFNKNQYIHVKFDEIEIYHHPNRPAFYGVSLRQGYRSSTYSDDGYLFLLWDFSNEKHPQIHVRVWEDSDHFINSKKKFSIRDLDEALTDM